MSGDQPAEDDLIGRISTLAARPGRPGVCVAIGDDAAVLEPTPGLRLIVTTDVLVEDVHFRRRWVEPADLGWKAVAVNVSDIAAMGAEPRWAVVGLAVPESATGEEVEAFYGGALALADEHGVTIVGGDTSASLTGWMVSVALIGEAERPVLRSGARPGDIVAVTGPLGRAAAGLTILEGGAPCGLDAATLADLTSAHVRPRPRVAEGRWLAGAGGVTAMMDISDGLAIDLSRLTSSSHVGARVRLAEVPIDPATRAAAAALTSDAEAWATGGGEDYELLVTCEASAFQRLSAGLEAATGRPLITVGVIEARPGIRWLGPDGAEREVAPGFQHFARRPGPAPAEIRR